MSNHLINGRLSAVGNLPVKKGAFILWKECQI